MMATLQCRVFVVLVSICSHATCQLTRQKSCWGNPVPPYLITHRCFADLCRCNNYTLDCSFNFGRLEYVPYVFDGVHVLNFSSNGLLQITNDDFFRNVSATVWLIDLLNNGLTYIAPGVFDGLPRLSRLLLGGNNLTYPALKPVLGIPNLDELSITCGHMGSVSKDTFKGSLMTKLTVLDLSWNSAESLDMHELKPLRSLAYMFLWSNSISKLTTASMSNLLNLAAYDNRLFDFPVTCQPGTNQSLFPKLTLLNLHFNMISSIQSPVCLPSLHVLYLEYNQFMYFYPGTFSNQRFPRLTLLYLNQMESKIQLLDRYTFNNSALRLIHLRLNNVNFGSEYVHRDTFAGCTNLQELNLEKNDLSSISDEKMFALFHHLPALSFLNLGATGLNRLSRNTLAVLRAVEMLDLILNDITHLPDGVFDQLPRLRTLVLDRNKISAITENTFNETLRNRLQSLYLADNPFDCSCRILWLQHWMRERPALFKDYHQASYNCSNIPMSLNDFYLADQACVLSASVSSVIIAVCSIVILCVTAVSLLFAYHWHVRLALYEFCRGDRRHWAYRRPRHFRYDVFVSYAEEDVGWVRGELLPVLEGRWGLKLCIHQRNFIPGKHIMDNISDSVEESEKILMVFSSNFARSPWCQFELKMCQTCVMDRDDVLVLVTLGTTSSYKLTGAMLALISTTTYLEWNGGGYDRTPFWARLRAALDDIFTNARRVAAHHEDL